MPVPASGRRIGPGSQQGGDRVCMSIPDRIMKGCGGQSVSGLTIRAGGQQRGYRLSIPADRGQMQRGEAVCCPGPDSRAFVYFCAYLLGCGGFHKTRVTQAQTVARMSGKSKQGEQGKQGGQKGGKGGRVCFMA